MTPKKEPVCLLCDALQKKSAPFFPAAGKPDDGLTGGRRATDEPGKHGDGQAGRTLPEVMP